MTLSRSLVGRTSFWWTAGSVVLGLNWVRAEYGPRDSSIIAFGGAFADQFYVELHTLYFVILGGAFAFFAAAYLGLERFHRGRHRQLWGGLHFGATAIGVAMLTPPLSIVGWLMPEDASADIERTFKVWTAIMGAGYGLTLVVQVFFVAALLDALRREPDPR